MTAMAEDERRALLTDLVELRRPVNEVMTMLRSYPWDVDDPLVQVRADDVVRVLRSFQSRLISSETVTEWADALELRDDVCIDENLSSFFVEASTPEVFEPISDAFASRWIAHLDR